MGTSDAPPNSVIVTPHFPESLAQVEFWPSRIYFVRTVKYRLMYTAVQLKFEPQHTGT
jgi:hypothetical protein